MFSITFAVDSNMKFNPNRFSSSADEVRDMGKESTS